MIRKTNKISARKVLKMARDLVATRWTRGQLHVEINGEDHYCALGALQKSFKVLGGDLYAERKVRAPYDNAKKAVMDIIAKNTEYASIIGFNDAHNRKQVEVVDVFDRALESL